MNPETTEALLTRMFRSGPQLKAGVSRAFRPLVQAEVLEQLRQINDDVWTTEDTPLDWSVDVGDARMLGDWRVGYSYDATVPAVEIRTPQVLLRHVGKGYGADILRAHMVAAEPPVNPGNGRVVVVSRGAGGAAGILGRQLDRFEATEWLRRHPADRWPLPTLRARLSPPPLGVPQAEWITVYDGPRRLVTVIRGQADHHIVAMEEVPELAHEHLRAFRPMGKADGPLLRVQLRLNDDGEPLAWPQGLDPQLLGSPTAWPNPRLDFIWWHRPEPNLAGRPSYEKPAARLGPVHGRPADEGRNWPLFQRQPTSAIPIPPEPPGGQSFGTPIQESNPIAHTVERVFTLPPSARSLMDGEGGGVYLDERDGEYLVITAEFDLAEKAGVPPCTLYTFSSEQDRLTYLQHRGWYSHAPHPAPEVKDDDGPTDGGSLMMELARTALLDFGCASEVVDLVTSAGSEQRLVVKTDEGSNEFLPVAAGANCEAAMYVERRRVYIALTPEDGRRLESLTGVGVAEKNPRTWRLKVAVADAVDPSIRGHLEEAVRLSLALSLLRDSKSRRDRGGRTPGTCPTCDIELPATGRCDQHGRPGS